MRSYSKSLSTIYEYSTRQLKITSACLVVITFIAIGAANDTQEQRGNIVTELKNIPTVVQEKSKIIPHTVLEDRSTPNRPNEYYLEILIIPTDATKENIVALVKTIVPTTSKKAVIGIYQDKQAWINAKQNQYGEIFDRGFVAHYTKNINTTNDFKGYNAIKWMQERGQLADLFGTETIIN